MDERKIDDEALAKEAIATSPDVTHAVIEEEAPEEKPQKAAKEPPNEIDEALVEKDSAIMATGLSSAYEQFSGEEFNNDQKYMLSAFARELFSFGQEAGVPRVARIAILGACCAIPFLPLIFRLKGANHGDV